MEQESAIIEKLAPSMLTVARAFYDRAKPLVEVLKRFNESFDYLYDTDQRELPQAAHRYALAGYPYGRHTKGKKRWLREMKARHK